MRWKHKIVQLIALFVIFVFLSGTVSAVSVPLFYENSTQTVIVYDDETHLSGLEIKNCPEKTKPGYYECIKDASIDDGYKELDIECSGDCSLTELEYRTDPTAENAMGNFPRIQLYETELTEVKGIYDREKSVFTELEMTKDDEDLNIYGEYLQLDTGDKITIGGYSDEEQQLDWVWMDLELANNNEQLLAGDYVLKAIKKTSNIRYSISEFEDNGKIIIVSSPSYNNLLTYPTLPTSQGEFKCGNIWLTANSGNLGFANNGLKCGSGGTWECVSDAPCLEPLTSIPEDNLVKFQFVTPRNPKFGEITIPLSDYPTFRKLDAQSTDDGLLVKGISFVDEIAGYEVTCKGQNCDILITPDEDTIVIGEDVVISKDGKIFSQRNIDCVVLGSYSFSSVSENFAEEHPTCKDGFFFIAEDGNTFRTDALVKQSTDGSEIKVELPKECEDSDTYTKLIQVDSSFEGTCKDFLEKISVCETIDDENVFYDNKFYNCYDLMTKDPGLIEYCDEYKEKSLILNNLITFQENQEPCPTAQTLQTTTQDEPPVTETVAVDENGEQKEDSGKSKISNGGGGFGNILTLGIIGGLIYLLAKKKKNKQTSE